MERGVTAWRQSAQHGKYVEVWSNSDDDDLQVHLTGKPERKELRDVLALLRRMGYTQVDSDYDLTRNRFIDTYRRVESQPCSSHGRILT